MSYYIHKKKFMVELSDGRILPIALVADSSITTTRWNGRREYEYHPVYAVVLSYGNKQDGILFDKDEYNRNVEKECQTQYELLIKFWEKYEKEFGEKKPDEDSNCYSGNRYPGGRSLKNMRSFLSAKRTISFQEFLDKCPWISIEIQKYDSKLNLNTSYFPVNTEDALKKANEEYLKIKDEGYMPYVSIFGIPGTER